MSKKRGQGGHALGEITIRAVVSQLSVEGLQYLPYGAVKFLGVWQFPQHLPPPVVVV